MSSSFFLLLLLAATLLSGTDPQWSLVSDSISANFASQVLTRFLLGATIRIALSRFIGRGITTDMLSIVLSQMFPSSLLLAFIAISGYAAVCFRYMYELLVTGHGIVWMYLRARYFFEDESQSIQAKNEWEVCSRKSSNCDSDYQTDRSCNEYEINCL